MDGFQTTANRYLGLRVRLILLLLLGGKLSLAKLWNAALCYLAYFLRREVSAASPLLINFELWNECNESCVFCRDGENRIFDTNPQGNGQVPKGKLPLAVYERVLERTASRLLMAVPYVNGEPLMSKDIYAAIETATRHRVGTLIASNGILLNERNARRLLEAGLDCLKIHISGFTPAVHSVQHRKGDVTLIKANIARFMALRREMGARTIVVLDYILYRHNQHELEAARAFAAEHGLLFNMRPGNNRGMEDSENPQHSGPLPVDLACDWLWTVLTVDWNAAVYPCCDYVTWSGAQGYGDAGAEDVLAMWNGPAARRMRVVHATQGRRPIPTCSQCPRQGVRFKW
jgi:hypothetical protein